MYITNEKLDLSGESQELYYDTFRGILFAAAMGAGSVPYDVATPELLRLHGIEDYALDDCIVGLLCHEHRMQRIDVQILHSFIIRETGGI